MLNILHTFYLVEFLPFMSLKSHEDGHGIVDAGVGVNDQLLHHDLDLDLRLGLQKYYIRTNFMNIPNLQTAPTGVLYITTSRTSQGHGHDNQWTWIHKTKDAVKTCVNC